MANVLVVVAHPDDEVLMCGGTIVKHISNSDVVHVIVMCRTRTNRIGDAMRVLRCSFEQHVFADQKLDTHPLVDIIRPIEKEIAGYSPSIVYTHWMRDLNKDHRIVSEAVQVACRPQPGHPVKTLLMGEVPSSTEWAGGFNPNWYVDVEEHWEKKIAALRCYDTEMRESPHPTRRKA